jgi:hypothetical protein
MQAEGGWTTAVQLGAGASAVLVLVLLVAVPWVPSAQAPQVTLAWDDLINTDQDGYLVQRRADALGSAYSTLASTDAATRAYTDRAVVYNQRVCYVVLTFRNWDSSVTGPSNEVCHRVRRN